METLVLGGGIGGVVASTVLKKALGRDMQVTVVDKESYHFYAAAYPLLMIGQRKPEQIIRKISSLKRKGIRVLQGEVNNLDLDKRQVVTDNGTLYYDYLIISLGVEFHPETVPGFDQHVYNAYDFYDMVKLNQKLKAFKEGNLVFFISSLPIKCPPAPYEMMFLLDQFFRQQGRRKNVKLTLVTSEPSPEPLAGPLVGESIRKMFAEREIELITQAKILAVEPGVLVLDHGTRILGDLFLGIPSHWCPEVLRKTDLADGEGWVDVDPHTLETKYPGVYAIGDCTALKVPVTQVYAPKAGIFAHYQAEVVARNIALQVKGKSPAFRYTGKGA